MINDKKPSAYITQLTSNNKPIYPANSKIIKTDPIIKIGQGLIGAQSKQLAIDWLKIIKTALIFVEENEDDLKEEFNSYKEEEPKSVNNDISNAFENFWD